MQSDQSLLITGATGLIGKNLTHKALALGIPVLALVRDLEAAEKALGTNPLLRLLPADFTRPLCLPNSVGAIVHGANPTSSKKFIEDPVGTIAICVDGTRRLLDYAVTRQLKSFLYLSSGEVYGQFARFTVAHEDDMGFLNPFAPRASYPEAKRLCETLCAAYNAQYGLHTIVARLGVIFGPLANQSDERLIPQFARCAREGKDIHLKTAGRTVRSYCYVDDATDALLLLLQKGAPATAYNVANPDMTLSVREIAERVSRMYPQTNVLIDRKGDYQRQGYLPELQFQMDASRLLKLGWTPKVGFETGFRRVYESVIS